MAKGSLGTLTVNILAKTAGIEKGTREGRKQFRALEKDVAKVSKGIQTSMKVAGAAVAAYAAVTAYAVKQELSHITAQRDLASSMGATVTGIRAINMAAEDSSIDGMEGSLARFTRRLGAVENGTGPAVKAIAALNLNAKELGKLDVDEKLAVVADAIKNTGISSQQATRYLQDLGFQQQGVYNIFKEGGDSIRQYRMDVERYGLAVSEIDAEKIATTDKSFTILGRTLQGINTQLSIELSGILSSSAEAFEEWALGGENAAGRVEGAVQSLVETLSFTIDVFDTLGRIGDVTWNVLRTGVAAATAGVAKFMDMVTGTALGGWIKLVEITSSWTLPGKVISGAFNLVIDSIGFTLDVMESLYRMGDITFKVLRSGVTAVAAVVFNLADSIAGTLLAQLAKLAEFGAKFNLPGAQAAADMLNGFTDGLSDMADKSAKIAEDAAEDVRKAIDSGLNTPFKASAAFKDVVDDATKAGKAVASALLPTAESTIDSLQGLKDGISIMSEVTADIAIDAANKTRTAWSDAINTPLEGGAAFESMIDQAKAAGQASAEAIVAGRKAAEVESTDPVEEQRIVLSAQLQNLVDYQKEKEVLLEEQYEREKEMLDKALEDEEIGVSDHHTAMLSAERKYQDGLKKLEEDANRNKLKGANDFFGNMSTLMNTESRKLFEIGKVAAYAGAVVDGLASAVSSYKFGASMGGPVLGASFAAASMLATGVQIQAIANTQFGGGSAAVSNTQAINNTIEPVQQQQQAPTQDIYLRGIDPNMMYDGAQVLQALNRQIEDGGRIVGVLA